MSDLSTNKILGASLATALVVAGLWVGVPKFFHASPAAKDGFAIAVAADTSGEGAAAADGPPDWGTVLKTADVSAGEAKTAVCKACHVFDAAGTNNIGPGLYGVLGRKPGSHPGFAYSSAMSGFGATQPVWDYEHVYEFLKSPGNYVSGTKMTYAGMSTPQDRINVIAYLHTLGSNLPVPAPNPKAAAPAAVGNATAGNAAAPASAAAAAPANAATAAKPAA